MTRRYRRRRHGRMSGTETAAAAVVAGLVLAAAAHSVGRGNVPASLTAARPPAAAAASAAGSKAVAYERARLGYPYVWGGTGPPRYSGYDCSGLTSTAWGSAGVSIPRTSEDQWAALPHISAANLRPGDLVFTYWAVDNQASPNHVQMYVGGGNVIGADTVNVEETPLSADDGHIVGYARPS
jgi:cell wall-associated NlpC family hydrolase